MSVTRQKSDGGAALQSGLPAVLALIPGGKPRLRGVDRERKAALRARLRVLKGGVDAQPAAVEHAGQQALPTIEAMARVLRGDV